MRPLPGFDKLPSSMGGSPLSPVDKNPTPVSCSQFPDLLMPKAARRAFLSQLSRQSSREIAIPHPRENTGRGSINPPENHLGLESEIVPKSLSNHNAEQPKKLASNPWKTRVFERPRREIGKWLSQGKRMVLKRDCRSWESWQSTGVWGFHQLARPRGDFLEFLLSQSRRRRRECPMVWLELHSREGCALAACLGFRQREHEAFLALAFDRNHIACPLRRPPPLY
jgi:hypothetical protein